MNDINHYFLGFEPVQNINLAGGTVQRNVKNNGSVLQNETIGNIILVPTSDAYTIKSYTSTLCLSIIFIFYVHESTPIRSRFIFYIVFVLL